MKRYFVLNPKVLTAVIIVLMLFFIHITVGQAPPDGGGWPGG